MHVLHPICVQEATATSVSLETRQQHSLRTVRDYRNDLVAQLFHAALSSRLSK